MRVIQLNQNVIQSHMNELLSIEDSVHKASSTIYSIEQWTELEFSSDLPGKFQFSRGVLDEHRLVAFLICSTPIPDMLHIHRLAVHESSFRKGISKLMMRELLAHWEAESQLTTMTAIVKVDNVASLSMFHSFGFSKMQGEELEYWMKQRGKSEIIRDQDRYIDHYSLQYHVLQLEKRSDPI